MFFDIVIWDACHLHSTSPFLLFRCLLLLMKCNVQNLKCFVDKDDKCGPHHYYNAPVILVMGILLQGYVVFEHPFHSPIDRNLS